MDGWLVPLHCLTLHHVALPGERSFRARAGSGHSLDGQAVVVQSDGHSQGSMLEILARRPEEH